MALVKPIQPETFITEEDKQDYLSKIIDKLFPFFPRQGKFNIGDKIRETALNEKEKATAFHYVFEIIDALTGTYGYAVKEDENYYILFLTPKGQEKLFSYELDDFDKSFKENTPAIYIPQKIKTDVINSIFKKVALKTIAYILKNIIQIVIAVVAGIIVGIWLKKNGYI